METLNIHTYMEDVHGVMPLSTDNLLIWDLFYIISDIIA